MKKIAIISDIHSNIEALSAVNEDIKSRNVDAIYCLGDVIGYGPNPIECLEKIVKICQFSLLGNHEEAVLSRAFGFGRIAKDAADWTRTIIKPGIFSLRQKRKLWKILHSFPLSYCEDSYLFVHGSPCDPTYEYILETEAKDIFGEITQRTREIFASIDTICFVGHSHKPGIMKENGDWYHIENFDYVWEQNKSEKIVCNVGSVGQPRDKDNRACYVTVTEEEIFYHRIPYDYEKTQQKIFAIPELDDFLAKRLQQGW